ncbi:unnamed protein product, partial [Mesorhabditis spiculigera]
METGKDLFLTVVFAGTTIVVVGTAISMFQIVSDISDWRENIESDLVQFRETADDAWAKMMHSSKKNLMQSSCKTFFLRAATSKYPFVCEAEAKCVYPNDRCRACRFQQCLAAGFRPEKVGHRSERRKKAKNAENAIEVPKSPGLPSLVEDHQRLPSVVFPATFAPSAGPVSVAQEVGRLMRVEEFCTADYPWIPLNLEFEFNLSTPISDLLSNPTLVCPRVPIGLSPSGNPTTYTPEMSGRTFARMMLYCCDFFRAMPEVWEMLPEDRHRFCMHSACLLIQIQMVYSSYKTKSAGLLRGLGQHYETSGFSHKALDYLKQTTNQMHDELFPLLYAAKLTHEEFLIWRMMVMLSPGPIGISDSALAIIARGRNRYAFMLAELLRSTGTELEAIQKMMTLSRAHRWLQGNANHGADFGITAIVQGTAAGGYYCFTADTEVEHMDGRMIRMDELKKNDIIKTLNGKRIGYSPNGKEVKLTGKHYIYASKCGTQNEQVQLPSGPIFAEMVQEGDCLFTVDEADITQSRVSKIELVHETGIYAPMTSNGKLIVNGIYASCHNVVQHHEVQRTFFDYLTSAGDAVKAYSGAEDVNEIPYGMGLLVQMMEFALPKAGF